MLALPQELIGRRIKWFREERGHTQDALSKRLGFKDRQTLSDVEAGKRRLTPDELVALTKALKIELDDLVDPFKLVGEGAFNFRLGDEPDPTAIESFEILAGGWIATYRELGRQVGIEPARLGQKLELTRESSFEDAAASAEALRVRWQLGDVPAATLEHAVSRELGTLVLYVDAPAGISAAASHLPGLQTILVNRTEAPSRRAFDLAHEVFHLLTWDAMPPARSESLEPRRTKGNRIEQLANRFASSLLMPESVVRARWSARADADLREWTIATAQALEVSPSALQYRLVNLGLLSKSQVVTITGTKSHSYAPTPPLFSAAFVARVHDAVEAGRLSLRRAAGLLGMSLGAFAELCQSYGRPLSYDA